MADDNYIMWLSRVNGLGIRKQQALLEEFGSAEAVFYAGEAELNRCQAITRENAGAILRAQDPGLLAQMAAELELKGIRFISRYSYDYPVMLRDVPDAPVGLYARGSLPPSGMPYIAVIGSRRCTQYGSSVAYKFSRDLAARGVVIVSGMAKGIDAMAHRGAIKGGGLTVAVLGCGVDVCYPVENRELMDEIVKNGCVVSEYPPGTSSYAANFPARNRIISGISRGVIVVEAALKSGTSITVGQALEQGRDVFAVPGNITSRFSEGTNMLIKNGAVPACDYTDILNELHLELQLERAIEKGRESENNAQNNSADNIVNNLANDERLVYDCIGSEPVVVDEIIYRLGIKAQTAACALTALELRGLVQRLPGQQYTRG